MCWSFLLSTVIFQNAYFGLERSSKWVKTCKKWLFFISSCHEIWVAQNDRMGLAIIFGIQVDIPRPKFFNLSIQNVESVWLIGFTALFTLKWAYIPKNSGLVRAIWMTKYNRQTHSVILRYPYGNLNLKKSNFLHVSTHFQDLNSPK